jgi:hypothetical protein
LLRLEEDEVNKASEAVEQMRQLLAEGLVTRLDVQKSELTLAAAQAKVEATTQQLANYEGMLVEIKEATEAHTLRAQSSNRAPGLAAPTILRYNGLAGWSPANLGSIEAFFSTKFGRALPTSVVGQGAIHNQWGFDHRKAVDVSLHPDSVEGKALINYLQSQGIPFLAFRTAIPGVATGPHIHIGNPSHRIPLF